jgi:hypothetical protein
MDNMPIITLTTGLRVANFSSPHEFRFTDGSVLPACEPARANLGKLNDVEVTEDRGRWVDIDLDFQMSDACLAMLLEAEKLWRAGEVDVVIVPFPVLNALKASPVFDTADSYGHPFRTIRSADRVTKTNHHDRFCV